MTGVPKIVKFLVIPLLLAIAAGGVTALALSDDGVGGSPEDQVIESLHPGDGDQTLRQGEVGIDLITGWDASLSIDAIPIPDDQLDKVVDLGQVTFRPGAGKVLPYLQAGQNCATATYWQRATGPEQSFTRTWCFSAL